MARGYRVVASSDDRPDWLAWRRKLITASDVAKVLRGPKSKAYQRLAAEKRGDVEPEDLSQNPFVMGGRFGEPGIFEMWLYFNQWRSTPMPTRGRTTPYLCQSNRFPFLGATPDGLAMSPVARRTGAVEIKFTNTLLMKNGRLVKNMVDSAVRKWADGPPVDYQIQHDTQMFVLGKDFGWIVAGIGFSQQQTFPRSFGQESRDDYIAGKIPVLEQFARDARIL